MDRDNNNNKKGGKGRMGGALRKAKNNNLNQSEHSIGSGRQRNNRRLRSSIIRKVNRNLEQPEMSIRGLWRDLDDEEANNNNNNNDDGRNNNNIDLLLSEEQSTTTQRGATHLLSGATSDGISSTDIRASPRLLGYLYTMIASAVMLASVAQYFRNNKDLGIFRRLQVANNTTTTDNTQDGPDVVNFLGNDVLRWKLTGALIVSIAGVSSSFLLFMAHFDTILFPQLWRTVFRDGSKIERNILLLNLLFWIGSIHVCTSSLSVGASQANVYFTTWIAFGASVLNFDIWRAGANLKTVGEFQFDRDTAFNWMWLIGCLLLASFSALDMYAHRDDLEFIVNGQPFRIPAQEWYLPLGLSFGFLGLSLIVFVGNCYVSAWKIKLCGEYYLEWRHFELLTILGLLGTWSWIIFVYTGVDDEINRPGNAYFGIWGTFFNTIFILGTWLRENRTLLGGLYFDDEEEDEEEDTDFGEQTSTRPQKPDKVNDAEEAKEEES